MKQIVLTILALMLAMTNSMAQWSEAETEALKDLNEGAAAIKAKDFEKAKPLIEDAIAKTEAGTRLNKMAHSWMGQWYSIQSLNLRVAFSDMEQALKLSLEAERCFDLANSLGSRLMQQSSRADILKLLGRGDEAEVLLRQVIDECGTATALSLIRGKALYQLGALEVEKELFEQAILHLGEAYGLCLAGAANNPNTKTYGYLAADKLNQLYTSQIPDNEKAALWKQRADELAPYYE